MMHAKLDYVFEFLEDLRRHNTRAWMHQRATERRYDVVQRTMRQWIAMLLLDMQDIEDTHGIRPADCLYRIWRDTRFSKDKTPCKTYLSFVIRHGGRKNEQRAAYYIQIGPRGQSFIGGGVYMPQPEHLRRIRSAIVRDGAQLHRIVTAPAFTKLYGGLEPLRLKTMPRDFKIPDAPLAVRALVAHTSWVATRELADEEVLSPTFDADIIRMFRVLKPLNDWLNEALGT